MDAERKLRAKLKQANITSGVMLGFSMVAVVEMQMQVNEVPTFLLITLAICTVALITVHGLSLLISTLIIVNIDEFTRLRLDHGKVLRDTPHTKMKCLIDLPWIFSTLVGTLLFLFEVGIIAWIRFYPAKSIVAWTVTGLLILVLLIFIGVTTYFYFNVFSNRAKTTIENVYELEEQKQKLVECTNGDPNNNKYTEGMR